MMLLRAEINRAKRVYFLPASYFYQKHRTIAHAEEMTTNLPFSFHQQIDVLPVDYYSIHSGLSLPRSYLWIYELAVIFMLLKISSNFHADFQSKMV